VSFQIAARRFSLAYLHLLDLVGVRLEFQVIVVHMEPLHDGKHY
jgi:hypothetical protein